MLQHGSAGEVWLLEHPHTVTLGRRPGTERSLLWSEEQLRQGGYTLHRVERGGDATYHGPGQLVCYPICNIKSLGFHVKSWIQALETTGISYLVELGIQAARWPGEPGVWLGVDGADPAPELGAVGLQPAKLMALGVHISRSVSIHGVALNLRTDLSRFGAIVPCGIGEASVTSVLVARGEAPTPHSAAPDFARHLGLALGVELEWCA
jgi:lipoyl(octanoyl) transferase